jgi:acylphosphatase
VLDWLAHASWKLRELSLAYQRDVSADESLGDLARSPMGESLKHLHVRGAPPEFLREARAAFPQLEIDASFEGEATVRFVARGLVQGVFYRDTAMKTARRLGVRGWIRNCPDGSVEGVASGDPQMVQLFLDWARRGPPAARVDELITTDEPTPVRTLFEVRR